LSKAIFFDRDGTLLVEVGYLTHPSLVIPYRFTVEALSLAKRRGFLMIAVTNQSGIARGYLTQSDLRAIHEKMQSVFRAQDVSLDAIYYCPHHPDGTVKDYRVKCSCRKPGIELGQRAVCRFGIDLERSFVIGDKETDLLFGRSLGATSCLVRTGFGTFEEERIGQNGLEGIQIFENVLGAVKWITKKDTCER
jgi:D-glycero-D-manno-heptose 1,7-bisphosphate phosphatase